MVMKQLPPQRRFEHALLEISRTHSIWTVFNDFLDYSMLMMRWWDIKASDFIELEKKYPDKRHAELFAEAYFSMADVADGDGTGFKDPFGDFFMEHLSNNHKGQFFTPESICEMIAKMQIGAELPDKATVADPCCGSGRLLLAAAKINRNALFYGMDVDLTCCKMTVINFMLNTLSGEVTWMNTITQERWKSWNIKKIMDGTGRYLPFYTVTEYKHTDLSQKQVVEPENPSSLINQSVKTKISKEWNEQSSQLLLNLD